MHFVFIYNKSLYKRHCRSLDKLILGRPGAVSRVELLLQKHWVLGNSEV